MITKEKHAYRVFFLRDHGGLLDLGDCGACAAPLPLLEAIRRLDREAARWGIDYEPVEQVDCAIGMVSRG